MSIFHCKCLWILLIGAVTTSSSCAFASSLCLPAEKKVFSCNYADKIASVCEAGTGVSRKVSYRFGKSLDAVELDVHNSSLENWKDKFSLVVGMQQGPVVIPDLETELFSFTNKDYEYDIEIVSDSISTIESASISVFGGKSSKQYVTLNCKKSSTYDNFNLFAK